MRRLCSLSAAIMLTFLFCTSSFAETLTVVPPGSSVAPGATGVTVDINVDDGSNIAGASFTVTYDSDLTLTNVTSSFFELFTTQGIASPGTVTIGTPPDDVTYDKGLVYNEATGSTMIAAANAQNGSEYGHTGSQTLFTLTFDVAGSASGDYPITITKSSILNEPAGYAVATEIPMLVNGDTYDEIVAGVTPGNLTIGSPGDTDSDGILDTWEIDNFGDLITADSVSDFDHDGYSDLVEYQKSGTNDLANIAYSPLVMNAPGDIDYNGSTDKRISNDFNGDGHSDVILVSSNGSIATWLISSNGMSISSGAKIGNLPTGWSIKDTGDFDGDGHTDLLIRNTNGTIATWLVSDTGTSIKSGAILATLPAEWSIQGTGDLDGDGNADILVRHTNGTVVSWLMSDDGQSIASGAVLTNLPSAWEIQGIADFDGDSHADIVLRNSGSIAIWIISNDGLSIEGGAILIDLSTDWTIKEAGDFDGDSHADLLLEHSDRRIAVWLIADSGVSIESGGFPATLPAEWTIQGTGDFDGDGHLDILLRHPNGQVVTWIIADNGISLEGGGILATTYPEWIIQ